ncbi:MAG TPA: MFS transporter, partial [Trueperaceae bacterium]|nr:MFS transporter [Trueperaceae bacterium]
GIGFTMSLFIGNLAFGVLSNRGRNVTVMQVGYALLMAAPICAMLIGDWRWYSVVFVLSAVGNAGVGIAASNLLYAIAPLGDRALYIGLSNTVLTIPSLAPVLAGALLTWLVMPTMFAAAAVLGAVTLAFSFRFGTLREADLRALGASRAQLASENESAASGDASPANAASQNVVTEVPEAD